MHPRASSFGATLAVALSVAILSAAQVPTSPPVFSHPLSITNRYMPFVPGTVKHYETQQGHTDAEDVDEYLSATRDFVWNGAVVSAHILQETSIEDGEIVEISRNHFAQADDGTVYYFGETVDLYDGGVIVGHGGSWLVGGPRGSDPSETATETDPNVFMPAHPKAGDVFKPEDELPFVDETDTVLRVGVSVSTPAGVFKDCIQIGESSVLSPDTETKWYAPGVGVVKVKEKGEVVALDDGAD